GCGWRGVEAPRRGGGADGRSGADARGGEVRARARARPPRADVRRAARRLRGVIAARARRRHAAALRDPFLPRIETVMRYALVLVASALLIAPAVPRVHTETVEYKVGGATMKSFLAVPEGGAAKKPGIVVFPEWW